MGITRELQSIADDLASFERGLLFLFPNRETYGISARLCRHPSGCRNLLTRRGGLCAFHFVHGHVFRPGRTTGSTWKCACGLHKNGTPLLSVCPLYVGPSVID